MSTNYSELLKDPRWQRKRLEIFQRDDFTCVKCAVHENTLHAHHIYYVANRKPWEYPNVAIQTLCEECHNLETTRQTDEYRTGGFPEWETDFNALAEWAGDFRVLTSLASAIHFASHALEVSETQVLKEILEDLESKRVAAYKSRGYEVAR